MKYPPVRLALLAGACAGALALTACDDEADRADTSVKSGDRVTTEVAPSTPKAPEANRDRAETTPDDPDTRRTEPAPAPGTAPAVIRAALKSPDGEDRGTVTLRQREDGKLVVRYRGSGLPEGAHAIHFHAKGVCDGPGFESAGDHWRPADWQAEGDRRDVDPGHLGTITVTGDQPVRATFTNAYASLKKDAPNSLFDQDGVSVVIHAKGDANADKPGGEAGARLACAVIKPAPAPAATPEN